MLLLSWSQESEQKPLKTTRCVVRVDHIKFIMHSTILVAGLLQFSTFGFLKRCNSNTWKCTLCSGTTLFFSSTTTGLPAISKWENFVCNNYKQKGYKTYNREQKVCQTRLGRRYQCNNTSWLCFTGYGTDTEISLEPSGKTTWNLQTPARCNWNSYLY